MPPFKNQHYLPVAYLSNFAAVPATRGRNSFIWRIDRSTQRLVPVSTQCAEDYFYSKLAPFEAEKMFHDIETIYCQCIEKIKTGRQLSGKDAGRLLLAMFDFHLRNAVHQNSTVHEGIEAYKIRVNIFLQKILLESDTPVSESDAIEHISRHWELRILKAPGQSVFLTSDNPSVWTCLKKSGLHVVSLPLTPTHIAIGFDRRILQIVSNNISSNDECTLNAGQVANSIQCVYASGHLSDEHVNAIKHHFNQKPNTTCEVTSDGWKMRLQGITPEHYFSFIRIIPPLM